MSNRKQWIWIFAALVAFVFAAVVWRDALWNWLLALHGHRH
ncbi:MAG TPA: hypothetical protein VGR66_13715 [Candidatus Eisenbacteria bacterium]|jgi:hypothetical protein|nr:hypothetical protein [Candidatus Eisenbacteria bacterium]